MNFSVSYPLKRHAFQRVGFTYSLTKSSITAFSTASQTFFQTISFRSGIQGTTRWRASSTARFRSATPTTRSTIRCARAPARNSRRPSRLQASGATCATSRRLVAYKSFRSMHYLKPIAERPQCARLRAQLGLYPGLRRRRGASAQPLLLRRRRRTARIRRPRRHALWLRAQPHDRAADQPRWHLRSARSQQSAIQPVHPGSDSGLWHRFDRRRYQPHHQCSSTAFRSSGPSRSRSSTISASTLRPTKAS